MMVTVSAVKINKVTMQHCNTSGCDNHDNDDCDSYSHSDSSSTIIIAVIVVPRIGNRSRREQETWQRRP